MGSYTPDGGPMAAYREVHDEGAQLSSEEDWSWRASWGTSVTLALRERGFGPCEQDPSDRIFTPRATILQRGKGSFAWCEGIVGIPDSAQEIEWQVEKLAYLIVIQSVVGSVVSAFCRNNNTFRWLRLLSAKFETCVMWESVSCQHAETDDIMALSAVRWGFCF